MTISPQARLSFLPWPLDLVQSATEEVFARRNLWMRLDSVQIFLFLLVFPRCCPLSIRGQRQMGVRDRSFSVSPSWKKLDDPSVGLTIWGIGDWGLAIEDWGLSMADWQLFPLGKMLIWGNIRKTFFLNGQFTKKNQKSHFLRANKIMQKKCSL